MSKIWAGNGTKKIAGEMWITVDGEPLRKLEQSEIAVNPKTIPHRKKKKKPNTPPIDRNGECGYCSRAVYNLTRDHFIPRSVWRLKFRHLPIKIVMVCQTCNNKKGDQMPLEYYYYLRMKLMVVTDKLTRAYYQKILIRLKEHIDDYYQDYSNG